MAKKKEPIKVTCRSAKTGEILPPDWKIPDHIMEQCWQIQHGNVRPERNEKTKIAM